VADATELLADALDAAVPSPDLSSRSGIGERIAMLVALRGDHRAAAELLGASAGLRGLLDQGEPTIRTLVTELVDVLGPQEYRTAFDSGFDLDREAAVARLRDAVRPPD
jgi:hypothetical protein